MNRNYDDTTGDANSNDAGKQKIYFFLSPHFFILQPELQNMKFLSNNLDFLDHRTF